MLYKFKKAFTLIELIFVIVILGIVASIGSSIIAQVYEAYIMQRSVHNASVKTELAINQLSNRLAYRINDSMLARIPGQIGLASPGDVYPIQLVPQPLLNTYRAMEWIGYDNDGFSATNTPAWSGVVDMNASAYATLSTTGSTLASEQTILNSLAGGVAANTPAIIFKGPASYRNDGVGVYDYSNTICMYRNNGCIFPVTLTPPNTLTFTGAGDRVPGEMIYSEFYQLAASAYAVVPVPAPPINGIAVWNLVFYSNYQPWLGQNYTNGDAAILVRNASVFRFKKEVNSIRIKICTIEQISSTDQISICKEKAVIR